MATEAVPRFEPTQCQLLSLNAERAHLAEIGNHRRRATGRLSPAMQIARFTESSLEPTWRCWSFPPLMVF